MKFILFLTFFIFSQAQALLITNIQILKIENGLSFKVRLENKGASKARLILNSKAQIIQYGNIQLSQDENKNHQIDLSTGGQGFIHYRLDVDLSRPYFVSGREVWHPYSLELSPDSVYSVQADLGQGLVFSSSATGFPQTDLAYVIGSFIKYEAQDKRLKVLLSKQDPQLAEVLLLNLKKYMDHFEKTIGPYPYKTFTVIEAPDEIGFAFPQMTWMGSQLLRFPFILKTSLPHELLHSWWGTSVFVDYESGNWCEGLTTFGADYGLLNSEEKKLYRIKALTSYLNYVTSSQELSLSQFTSRGENRSLQALGYDKSLMVFVMLEQLIGEDLFSEGLKLFYSEFKFKKASWDDLFQIMSRVSQKNLKSFQDYWIQKPGYLSKDFIQLKRNLKSIQVQSKLGEIKKIPGVQIPISIHSPLNSEKLNLRVSENGQSISPLDLASIPKAVEYSVDSDFYLFRDLSVNEKPLNFSEFFGAQKVSYKIANSEWLESLKNTFPNKSWQLFKENLDWNLNQIFIVDLSQGVQIAEIKRVMALKKISLNGSQMMIENQKVDLTKESVFLSLKVKNTSVFLINLNSQLPLARWISRWSRYGGQSYVVLNSTNATLQGVWVDLFKRSL